MKKIIANILIITCLIGSIGLRVNQHYCCGNLVSLQLLLASQAKDCSGLVPVQKKKCCSDKQQELKVDNSQKPHLQIALKIDAPKLLPAPIHHFCFIIPTAAIAANSIFRPSHVPPDIGVASIPPYIRYRKLLI